VLPDARAGCGCSYPDWVDDATVLRSNRIIEWLRATASPLAGVERLAKLPMHLVAEVGSDRVAVVHGDAESLAGWGFSQEALATASGFAAALDAFESTGVRIFASSHTCLPVLQCFAGDRVLVNNGSAGMPNFRGTRFRPGNTDFGFMPPAARFTRRKQIHCSSRPCLSTTTRWLGSAASSRNGRGTDAHRSYFDRIAHGPRYEPRQALRRETGARRVSRARLIVFAVIVLALAVFRRGRTALFHLRECQGAAGGDRVLVLSAPLADALAFSPSMSRSRRCRCPAPPF